jgi:RNA recognition motif-containing protein
MSRKLYVTNLTYGIRDRELQELFGAYGAVRSAQVALDRDTGRSKGFGFVEMQTDQDAQAALAGLNGKEVEGRTLVVTEARPREGNGGGPREGRGRGSRKRPPALARRLRRPRSQGGP